MTPEGPDERTLLRWQISFRAFVLRCCFLLVLTMIASALMLPYYTVGIWLVTAALVAVFYMWIFDDFQIWYANRKTHWRLTNRALYIEQADNFEPLVLPLTDIVRIGRLSLWSIVLQLPNRQSITLPLVPDVRATKAKIAAAREVAHAR